MGIPENIHVDSNRYYDSIKELKDAALVASRSIGQRRKIGIFTFGAASAAWQSIDGGMSVLREDGIMLGNDSLFHAFPTTLLIYGEANDNGARELVNYRMELDDFGLVRETRAMLVAPKLSELVRARIGSFQDSVRNLDWPTNESLELLYDELERGASGAYSFGRSQE